MENTAQTQPQRPTMRPMMNFGVMREVGWKKFLMGLLFVLLAGFIWQWVSSPMVVSVTGIGRVTVPVQKATLAVTISAINDDPSVAVSEMQNNISRVNQVLAESNIPADDITTSQLQLIPAGALVAGATGYQATSTLQFETQNVSGLNDLVVRLYRVGATVVSQPVLSVENQQKLEQQALAEALQEAKGEAADLGWKKLKFIRKVVSITQASSGQQSTASKISSDVANGTQVEFNNGSFEIVRGVSVIYKMW